MSPSPSLVERQSTETNIEVPNKDSFVPTQAKLAKLKEIERVVLDKEDTCMDTEDPEDENTLASFVI